MWQSWINIAFGFWVFLSGFGYLAPWNFFTSGFFIAFFGFLYSHKQWQGIVNGLLGIWLIISTFSPVLINRWNLWITGSLVVIFAIWRSTTATPEAPAP